MFIDNFAHLKLYFHFDTHDVKSILTRIVDDNRLKRFEAP
jgi:hypothetical protein